MNNFKITIVFLTISICVKAQNPIRIGESLIKPQLVDGKISNIYGLWKIIHKEYVLDLPKTYEVVNLRDWNPAYFKKREAEGKVEMGNQILISDSIFYPFTGKHRKIKLNPKFRTSIEEINTADMVHDPRIGNQKLRRIDMLCPLYKDPDNQIESSFYFVTKDIIFTYSNNECTYLERVKDLNHLNKTFKTDNEGYYYLDVWGTESVQFFVDGNTCRFIECQLENLPLDKNIESLYCSYEENTNCNKSESKQFFESKNPPKSRILKIPISFTGTKIVELSGFVNINDKIQWKLKWRLVNDNTNHKPDPKITITTPKSFFYQDASEAKPKKSFLLKGDIAFVEETKGDWLFIRFEGKTITRGWMHKKNVQYLK